MKGWRARGSDKIAPCVGSGAFCLASSKTPCIWSTAWVTGHLRFGEGPRLHLPTWTPFIFTHKQNEMENLFLTKSYQDIKDHHKSWGSHGILLSDQSLIMGGDHHPPPPSPTFTSHLSIFPPKLQFMSVHSTSFSTDWGCNNLIKRKKPFLQYQHQLLVTVHYLRI